MPSIVITVNFEDAGDFDYYRKRCVDSVEDLLDELNEEGKLDGDFHVSWDTED